MLLLANSGSHDSFPLTPPADGTPMTALSNADSLLPDLHDRPADPIRLIDLHRHWQIVQDTRRAPGQNAERTYRHLGERTLEAWERAIDTLTDRQRQLDRVSTHCLNGS